MFLDCTIQNIGMSDPTTQIYDALLTVYKHFNQTLFGGKLPPVIIVLQRQAKAMGYVSLRRWSNAEGATVDELAVNPEYFMGFPLLEVLATILHEMVHVAQLRFGNPGRRGYHNREFANMMKEIGLMTSSTGLPFGDTTGEHMADYALYGGKFFNACVQLIDQGFHLPWLDREPQFANYMYRTKGVFDKNGRPVNLTGKRNELQLLVPLGTKLVDIIEELEEGDSINSDLNMDDSPPQDLMSSIVREAMAYFDGVSASTQTRLYPTGFMPMFSNKKPPTRVKYSCRCKPKNNLWGRPGLRFTCDECEERFVPDEAE